LRYPDTKVLYIDVENQLDLNYARALIAGLDTKRFIIAQPETAEQVFQLTEKAINSGEFSVIVLDSVGALSPEKEKEDEFTDANVALTPRALSKFFRRDAYAIRQNNVAFLFINQVRDKIGAYIATFETPGGHALKHYTSLRIQLTASEQIKQGDQVVGIQSKFVIKKNKLAPPFRSATFPIMFGKGIDSIRDIVQFGVKLGTIKTRGAYFYFEDENLGQGSLAAMETISKKPDLLDKIVKTCYNIVGTTNTILVAREEAD
jgi:recombination protein RecA